MIGFFLRIEHEDSGMQMGINNKSVTARQILRNFSGRLGNKVRPMIVRVKCYSHHLPSISKSHGGRNPVFQR